MMYLSPIFYPKEILSDRVLTIVNANPLTSYLDVFRFVFSNTGTATTNDWLYMGISSVIFFMLGIRVFSKAWPKTAVML
jgi:ABC-type polysaccharide/polyol phosphate export permease